MSEEPLLKLSWEVVGIRESEKFFRAPHQLCQHRATLFLKAPRSLQRFANYFIRLRFLHGDTFPSERYSRNPPHITSQCPSRSWMPWRTLLPSMRSPSSVTTSVHATMPKGFCSGITRLISRCWLTAQSIKTKFGRYAMRLGQPTDVGNLANTRVKAQRHAAEECSTTRYRDTPFC